MYDRVTGSYPVNRPEFNSALPTFDVKSECEEAAQSLELQYRK